MYVNVTLTHRLAEVSSSQGNRAANEGRFEALINKSCSSFGNVFLQRFNITYSKVNYKGQNNISSTLLAVYLVCCIGIGLI